MKEFLEGSKQPFVNVFANNLGYNIDGFNDERLNDFLLLASMCFDPCNIPEVKYMMRWNGIDQITKDYVYVFTGKEGAGKTTAMSIVAGVLMGGKDFAGLQRKEQVKRVLWIDTEKPAHSIAKKMQVFCQIAGFPIERAQENGLFLLQMRNPPELKRVIDGKEYIYSTEQSRREYIDMAIKWVQPELVVIDGIFDCVTDDELTTPREVVHWLEDLTSKDITIFTSIHTNKADNNLPYQIGHELTKKCGGIFLCKRDEDTPTITVQHVRAESEDKAKEVKFMYLPNGQVQAVDQYTELREQVKTIFADVEQFEGWDSIKAALKKKCDLNASPASKLINTAISRGYIKKDGLTFTKLLL